MKLDNLSRSPISTLLAEALNGLATIRAYGKTKYFEEEYGHHADRNGNAFFTFHVVVRAFGFYLDLLSLILIVGIVFAAFGARDSTNPLILALVIQLANDMLGSFQFAVRISSDL